MGALGGSRQLAPCCAGGDGVGAGVGGVGHGDCPGGLERKMAFLFVPEPGGCVAATDSTTTSAKRASTLLAASIAEEEDIV